MKEGLGREEEEEDAMVSRTRWAACHSQFMDQLQGDISEPAVSPTRRKDDFADAITRDHPDDELLAGGGCLLECLHRGCCC